MGLAPSSAPDPGYRNAAAWLEINGQAISHNTRVIQKLAGSSCSVLAVVKADGYGLGGAEVARAAKAGGAAALGLASAEEALVLERFGIRGPFFLLHPCQKQDVPVIVERDYVQAITHSEIASLLSREAVQQGKRARVHLNVNVGMNRLGLKPVEILDQIGKLLEMPGLQFTGVFAHFSSADGPDKEATLAEFRKFEELLQALAQRGISFPVRHMANSAALLDFPQFSLDMVRTGILLFGIPPSTHVRREPEFRPALLFKTRVVHAARIEKGEAVSYGRTWTAPEEGNLVSIPVGYAHGFPLALSNQGQVLIRGERFPIAGRVCMDISVIYLGKKSARPGEEVVLLGEQGGDRITVLDWAAWGKLDPHQILTGLGPRLPKIYIRSNP